jgi:ABC-type nitrate/sulfonate/bicarbonate transport system substrate-binding protein
VLPPPLMTKGLESGFLDGFCVGAPWNSLAVAQGIGSILHFGVEVVRDCPEKVLALRADWASAHVDETNALAGSILDASRWCSDPANLDEMAALVSQECGSPVTAAITRSILSGALTIEPGGTTRENKDYFRYDPDAILPRASDASWLYRQRVDGGQLVDTAANADAARAVYRNSATPATPREPKPFL